MESLPMGRSPIPEAAAGVVRAPRKAAFASWIGSALEYYDFFIYGTAAALVFGKIFFPSVDPKLATVAAFATFGVGYVTRPIGAFFMGHIGYPTETFKAPMIFTPWFER